jgi:hypothetical protein
MTLNSLASRFNRWSSENQFWTLLIAAVLPILLRIAALPLLPVPLPTVQDEFSHLLAADTLLHQRLVNPSPKFPEFFEVSTVLVQPVYASKYLPGQALFMATGIALFQSAWAGLLLACALMSAAVFWMLRAWFSPVYALVGWLTFWALFLLGPGLPSINSFIGGPVFAAGVALAIGGSARFRQRLTHLPFWVLGVVLIAFSRPFEGSVVILFTAAEIGWSLIQSKRVVRLLRSRGFAVSVLIAFSGIWFLTECNQAVTGNRLRLPYQSYFRQYGATPVLWVLPKPPMPVYLDGNTQRHLTGWEMEDYQAVQDTKPIDRPLFLVRRFVDTFPKRLGWIILALALVSVVFAWRSKPNLGNFLLITVGSWALLLLETWMMPHYLAGVCVLFCVPFANSAEWLGQNHLSVWLQRSEGWPKSQRLSKPILLALAVLLVAAVPLLWRKVASLKVDRITWTKRWQLRLRPSIEEQITAGNQDRHLIFVRYQPKHNTHFEWCFNGADLPASRVLWVHDRGLENARLLNEFPGRKVWYFDPDDTGAPHSLPRITQQPPTTPVIAGTVLLRQ